MDELVTSVARSSQVRLSNSVLSAEVDRDFVLMHPGLGHFYGFNEIGNSIWPQLRNAIRVGDLCDALCLRFDADPGVIEKDVLAFISDLLSKRFVELVD